MHIEPAIDEIVTSHGCPVTIALEENGPLLARYRVEYKMTVPAGPGRKRRRSMAAPRRRRQRFTPHRGDTPANSHLIHHSTERRARP